MNIAQAARSCGVTAKMIRYYERIGLIPKVDRKLNGYRAYNEADVHRLCFIRRAHGLGFSLNKIRDLLDVWNNRERSSAEVKALADAYLLEMEMRSTDLAIITKILRGLAQAGDAEQRPEVPMIEDPVESRHHLIERRSRR